MGGAEVLGKGKKSRKPRTVNLGRKGSFKIKKPGDFRRKAQRAGMPTKAYARKVLKSGRKGETFNEARSAIGLMSMGKK